MTRSSEPETDPYTIKTAVIFDQSILSLFFRLLGNAPLTLGTRCDQTAVAWGMYLRVPTKDPACHLDRIIRNPIDFKRALAPNEKSPSNRNYLLPKNLFLTSFFRPFTSKTDLQILAFSITQNVMTF